MNRLFPLALVAVLLAVLTGCATLLPSHTSVVTHTQVTLPEPIVELPAPIPEITEYPVRIRELNERAVVRLTDKEIRCMATAIYREAGGEPIVGQIAVGYVILNRMGYHAYPNTACGVIYDHRHGIQFSWTAPHTRLRPIPAARMEEMKRVALLVLNREVENPIDDSLFFRAHSIRGSYRQVLRARIGGHGFYAKV